MPLQIHNTLTNALEPFVPADPDRITFYSCGPTVYDDVHIGNLRAFLMADLVRRWIESPLCTIAVADGSLHRAKRTVVQVMNITDVGHMTDDSSADGAGQDKMAAAGERIAHAQLEAKKAGTAHTAANVDPNNPASIAAFYTNRFIEDATKLGVRVVLDAQKDPTLLPRATDHVNLMISTIERLIERGHAYVVGESSAQIVYFDVHSFAQYGRLSGNTIDRLREGAGERISTENQSQKKHPSDFLLWKSDSTHVMKWASPWGSGYPGWHIECSAMAVNRLAPALFDHTLTDADTPIIDIHSGGEDNIFPHHECEIAQSCCAFNAPDASGAHTGSFARLWLHCRFLLVEGEKMSKSKGNFYTARDLFAKGIEPGALRLELIRVHYRSNANFSEQGLKDTARMVARWKRVIEQGDASNESGSPPETMLREFADAMDDDLNIARAIAAVNTYVGEMKHPTKADADAMRQIDEVLGVMQLDTAKAQETEIGVFLGGLDADQRVIDKLIERRDAKKAKDFGRADAIRDELAQMGYAIKDVAGGKVEVSRA
ncbi:MAG: cysteine--tRNA ligase [Phycisphaeraceae bacterium]|nr:cysteine--tRNA ligase [Phycisphaerales bacterium]MCB9859441.1 cysteine--tRNA ligase [Phycisphaeraceae bacterium]